MIVYLNTLQFQLDKKTYMKYIKLMLFVLIPGVLALSACSKKSTPQPAATSSIAFQFNGTSKATSNVAAINYTSQNSLQIVGQLGPTEQIVLQFDTLKTGSFNVATDGVVTGYSPDGITSDIYFGTTGTLNLTSFNGTTATGSFNFVGKNSLNVTGTVTQGTFSVQYTKQ